MNAFPLMRFSTELTDHSGWTVLSIKFYSNSKEKIKLLFQKPKSAFTCYWETKYK